MLQYTYNFNFELFNKNLTGFQYYFVSLHINESYNSIFLKQSYGVLHDRCPCFFLRFLVGVFHSFHVYTGHLLYYSPLYFAFAIVKF